MPIPVLSPIKLFLSFIIFSLFMVSVSLVFAYPEGELYWATEDYPDNTFLYDSGETYTGAMAALEYACQQDPGGSSSGTYTGQVDIDSQNFPAEKVGACQIHYPGFPNSFDGNSYTAYLYCNGIKRDMLDDNPVCEAPAPTLDPNKNLGHPPCQ